MDPLHYIRNDIFYLAIDLLVAFIFITTITLRKDLIKITSIFVATILALKLIIFVGLRPFNAGNDTATYHYIFQLLDGVFTSRKVGGGYGATDLSSEFLYWPFASIIKPIIGGSFRIFLIVSILISGYLIYLANRKLVELDNRIAPKNQLALSIVFTYFVFLSLEIAYFGGHIRSALGVPLALISYCFAIKKNPIASGITFLLALGFHNSSISILPLILIEIFTPNLLQNSRSKTIAVITLLSATFMIGKFIGIDGIMGNIGGYYAARYIAYAEYGNFNIDSVFTTAYFWIILFHLALFLIIGYRKLHFYAFYYMALILIFSSSPKISERFFAYILACLPFLLYHSLRTRFGTAKSLIATTVVSATLNPLVVTSYAVVSSLNLLSYIIPRH